MLTTYSWQEYDDAKQAYCFCSNFRAMSAELQLEKVNRMWSTLYREMVDRNIGILSVEEQEKLRTSCIAVAGCGGMGGIAAEQLVRLGVGRIKIADFDAFQIHNLSRQAGSMFFNAGMHKAAALAQHFQAINPELKLEVFTDGVQPGNVGEFVLGANAVIDAIDYTRLFSSVILHREARMAGLCIINPGAIGFGVAVLVFGPNTVDIETYVGLNPGSPQIEIEAFSVPLSKFCPHLPAYADPETAMKAASGEIIIPNIIMPQHLGAAIAVSEAVMMILSRVPEPAGPDPRIFILDLQERRFEVRN